MKNPFGDHFQKQAKSNTATISSTSPSSSTSVRTPQSSSDNVNHERRCLSTSQYKKLRCKSSSASDKSTPTSESSSQKPKNKTKSTQANKHGAASRRNLPSSSTNMGLTSTTTTTISRRRLTFNDVQNDSNDAQDNSGLAKQSDENSDHSQQQVPITSTIDKSTVSSSSITTPFSLRKQIQLAVQLSIDELFDNSLSESKSRSNSPKLGNISINKLNHHLLSDSSSDSSSFHFPNQQINEQIDLNQEEHSSSSVLSSHSNTTRKLSRNHKGETELHLAAIRGDFGRLEYLLSTNCAPDFNNIKKSIPSRSGDQAQTTTFTSHDCDINVQDFAGWTALHEACNRGHTQAVRVLLNHGADVNATASCGTTPLIDAVGNGHQTIVKLLLKHGADPLKANKKGVNALDLAQDDQEILELLLTHNQNKKLPPNKKHPSSRPQSPTCSFKSDKEHSKLISKEESISGEMSSGINITSATTVIPSSSTITTTAAYSSASSTTESPCSTAESSLSSSIQMVQSCSGITSSSSSSANNSSSISVTSNTINSTGNVITSTLQTEQSLSSGQSSTNTSSTPKSSIVDSNVKKNKTDESNETDSAVNSSPNNSSREESVNISNQAVSSIKQEENQQQQASMSSSDFNNSNTKNKNNVKEEKSNAQEAASTSNSSFVADSTSVSSTNENDKSPKECTPGPTTHQLRGRKRRRSGDGKKAKDNFKSKKGTNNSNPDSAVDLVDSNVSHPDGPANNPNEQSEQRSKSDPSSNDTNRPGDSNGTMPSNEPMRVPPLRIVFPSSGSSGSSGGTGSGNNSSNMIVINSTSTSLSGTERSSHSEQSATSNQPYLNVHSIHHSKYPYVVNSAAGGNSDQQANPESSENSISDSTAVSNQNTSSAVISSGGSSAGTSTSTTTSSSSSSTSTHRITRSSQRVAQQRHHLDDSDSLGIGTRKKKNRGGGGSGNSSNSNSGTGNSSNSGNSASNTIGSNSANSNYFNSSGSSSVNVASSNGANGEGNEDENACSTNCGNNTVNNIGNNCNQYQYDPEQSSYRKFMSIREHIHRRRQNMIVPTMNEGKQPPGYNNYLVNRCDYLLRDPFKNLLDHLPMNRPPPQLEKDGPLYKLFREQEKERNRLSLKHQVEREKLILAVQQETLRLYNRADLCRKNQTMPLSVCTYLKDEELYNKLELETDHSNDNVIIAQIKTDNPSFLNDGPSALTGCGRIRFNGRVFLSWKNDDDEKWNKVKIEMLNRQRAEAEALKSIQRLHWEWKMAELEPETPSIMINQPIIQHSIHESFVPMVRVAKDFDLKPV